jgi:Holliday junction DNA helicase RuvA
MIITLTGQVTHKLEESLVLDIAGLGYEVFVTPAVLSEVKRGDKLSLWTYEHLREDTQEIYGFSSRTELELYRKLVAISGVGPKTGQHLLGLGTVEEVEAIIERGDVEAISRVPRIGKKTAQKIILELKGKLVQPAAKPTKQAGEVVLALVNMGYDRRAAAEAVDSVREKEETVEGQLKAALRELSR